jgi:hypothetical protein
MSRLLIVLALLVVGFGAGLYASGQLGSDEAPKPKPPPAAVSAPAPAAPASSAPVETQAVAPEEPAPPSFAVASLSPAQRGRLRAGGFWHSGCPVPLSGLRALTVSYWDFEGERQSGELVVNGSAAHRLKRAFRRLYAQRFPIRHIGFAYFYGKPGDHPSDGDVTGSFECREAVPSPCSGGTASGNWSNHAYGLAVDLNPTENPYIGCGQSRDPATRPFRDRSRHRRGMVDDRVVEAFGSVGWEWGGAWAGDTKDYMHFSENGH